MRLIPLTQGFSAKVDDDKYDYLMQWNWYYNSGYAIASHKGNRIRMHRLVMGAKKGQQIDHKNTADPDNRINNQRSNLRFSNQTQNNRNRPKARNNTTGYIGICLERSTGNWRPNIYIKRKAVNFGHFKDKHQAALARDLWAVDIYGEFAVTNFPVVSATSLKPKSSSAWPANPQSPVLHTAETL